MASSGKKKTTMAKLQREGRLRERRLDKQARKTARKLAAANPVDPADELLIDGDSTADDDDEVDARDSEISARPEGDRVAGVESAPPAER